jgi:intracellular septation protein
MLNCGERRELSMMQLHCAGATLNMQTLVDFLPVLAFVLAYWLTKDFYFAILVIMVAVVIQLALTLLMKRSIPRLLLISSLLVVGLGGISLWLNNPLIFKWKPTVLYWLFAVLFLGSQFIGDKPMVQRLLQSMSKQPLQMADHDWTSLNLMWAVFFFIAGTANIVVAYSFEEFIWVNFKLFGLIGLTLVFLILQGVWMTGRLQDEDLEPDQRQ